MKVRVDELIGSLTRDDVLYLIKENLVKELKELGFRPHQTTDPYMVLKNYPFMIVIKVIEKRVVKNYVANVTLTFLKSTKFNSFSLVKAFNSEFKLKESSIQQLVSFFGKILRFITKQRG